MVRSGKVRPSQVRSGQVRLWKVIWFWKYIYNIHRAIQKLPTKFYANRVIEPREIAVDTQIASGHLVIFAIYLYIETGILKSFKVPAILFGTLHGDILPMICAKYWIFEEAKYLKMLFFKGHSEVMTLLWLRQILMVELLKYFFFSSRFVRLNALEQKLQAAECCNTRENSWSLMTSKSDPRSQKGLKCMMPLS